MKCYTLVCLEIKTKNMNRVLVSAFLLLIGQQVFAQGKPVSLEDVWKRYSFFARSTASLNSMNDGKHYTALTNADNGPTIEKFSYKTGKSVGFILSSKVIKEQTGKDIRFDNYEFGPSEDKVLLATNTQSIYRHSSKSNYYVYDLSTSKLEQVDEGDKQQLASFSPTRNQVAFVSGNKMHIKNFERNANWDHTSFGTGAEDEFIAGAVDWVYEEEFSFDKGFEWSPNGDYIAYYQFDEREVPMFSMDVYGKGLYQTQYEFKYPKAGEHNSIVNINLFNLKSRKSIKVKIDDDFEYIPRIKWTVSGKLVLFTMNRHQNWLKLWLVNPKDGTSSLLYKEEAEAYIEINDNIRFLKDDSFIWTSEKDGFNHIYHIGKDGKVIQQITSGNWDVTEFYGIDEKRDILYYQSAEESPLERAVYSIKLNGKSKNKLSKLRGWNSAQFSKTFKYYVNTYSSKDVPTLETVHLYSGNKIRTITDNAGLKEHLRSFDLSNKEFFKFSTPDDVELNGWMIKPQNFDPGRKYPVLMFVYGGPGSQTVKNQYDGANTFWYQVLANKGYIVVSVDNRGTGARGRDFRTVTYQQLGKYETQDQIHAANYLKGLPYVEKNRVGIWGWSYGGYMSSLALTKGADVFKLAIAVAPVTNWRFYDSIYTERYMRTPQENADGYDDNSPINHVKKMKGRYLLVHGSADDNVHVQNTMRMIDALVQADKQFDLFIYPDKNHGIYGGNTRYHLYTKMTDFITENL